MKGTNYGTDIVDRFNSASVWRSAQLGLSLVWLRSLGDRRDDIDYRADSIPDGPNLGELIRRIKKLSHRYRRDGKGDECRREAT